MLGQDYSLSQILLVEFINAARLNGTGVTAGCRELLLRIFVFWKAQLGAFSLCFDAVRSWNSLHVLQCTD